jgi:hypothetical protein
MIPEELNRTFQFIADSQARLTAAQEQDREDRVQFEHWAKGLFNRQTELLEHQSRRMDRLDKFYEDWLAQNHDFQQQVLRFQERALQFQERAVHLLNMILDRLPPPLQP